MYQLATGNPVATVGSASDRISLFGVCSYTGVLNLDNFQATGALSL